MLLKQPIHRVAPRQGVILMVVLAMLTLFAIVGITFVLFSDATALSARVSREAETQIRPDVDPELALSYFLGQMIYDVHDDATGVQSALRGHSFARTMYGANFTATGANWTGDNSLPYNGSGRLHYAGPKAPGGADLSAADEYQLVNYTWFQNDKLLRDPERYYKAGTVPRSNPGQAMNPLTELFTGGFNAPYTYCDANSMFMAYMDTSTGEIKVPSFHRETIGAGGFGRLDDPANPNWTNVQGKYLTLRPRPADHKNPKTGAFDFPMPQDRGGDVKNLDWAPGGCDSIWIDIGAPVQTLADGRKYKMLVAPLILDLDGKLNLNVAGNILAVNNGHASNQGWGAWEMNPSKVLNSTTSPNEWQNLFLGSAYGNTTNNYGRYGSNGLPNGNAVTGGTFLHNYGQADFNGIIDPGQVGARGHTNQYLLAGAAGNPQKSWNSFLYYPPTGYGNFVPLETTTTGTNSGIANHPSIYNPLRASGVAGDDDRRFSVQSMHALLRFGGSGSEFVTTDLRLLMNNLALDQTKDANGNLLALKRRLQVTTLSMDLDRPGVLPYIWDPNDQTTPANRYRLDTSTPPLSPLATR